MWFRNLIVFRLPAPWPAEPDMLEQHLSRRELQPCGALDRESSGWLPPRPQGPFVHRVGGHWLLRAGQEQKLLPASVVNQVVADRALELAQQQGFDATRRQMRELRERVAEELLPRAFARRRSSWVWIDPAAGWLAVDAASDNRAEEVVSMLLDTIGELPLRPLQTERSPSSAMTAWLAAGEAPSGFTIDRELELRAPDEEKATVRYVRHNLDGEEIASHIKAGKSATRLAMTWNDRVSLVLTESGQLRRLALLDSAAESADSGEADADAEFDARFALTCGEMSRLLPDLIDALGGERAVQA